MAKARIVGLLSFLLDPNAPPPCKCRAFFVQSGFAEKSSPAIGLGLAISYPEERSKLQLRDEAIGGATARAMTTPLAYPIRAIAHSLLRSNAESPSTAGGKVLS